MDDEVPLYEGSRLMIDADTLNMFLGQYRSGRNRGRLIGNLLSYFIDDEELRNMSFYGVERDGVLVREEVPRSISRGIWS